MLVRVLFAIAVLAASIAAVRAEDFDRILEAGVVRAGICLNAEPIGFRDSDGMPRGYDVDVAILLAEALGVRLEVVEVSSVTRIADLINGRIDVIVCNITATTERALTIDFSHPYLRTGTKLLVQRDSGITGIDDIGADTRLVVPRGTTAESLARKRAPLAQLIFADPGDATLLMRAREADAYLDDSLVVDYMAKAHADQMMALPETYSFDAVSFAIRRGNPGLLRWLDLFASIYVSSGKYAEVYGKWWGGTPPPLFATW